MPLDLSIIPPSSQPVPRRCEVFCAKSYPPDWTLHVAAVFLPGSRSVSGQPEVRHVHGRNVGLLNRYAAMAQRRRAVVYAWTADDDDIVAVA